MPSRDLHQKPFDAGTLIKLDLFRRTAEGFLGVFVGSGKSLTKSIKIFDFFCGPGLDSKGKEGSPVLILSHLQGLKSSIEAHGQKVDVLLNDSEPGKQAELKKNLIKLGLHSGPYSIRYGDRPFLETFAEEVAKMEGSANLVLIDQNGVNQFPTWVFERLRKLPMTDVLVFMSSSYAWRFQEEPEMQRHLETAKVFGPNTNFHDTHRAMVNYYRSLVPPAEHYFLAPFSIKKGSNIYGVMFGSPKLKGLEKFLEACWRVDSGQGEANFDIDREGRMSLPDDLPLEWGKTKKVTEFERELENGILTGRLATTADIYIFALQRGFLPKHANAVLRVLHKGRRIARITGLGSKSVANPSRVILLE